MKVLLICLSLFLFAAHAAAQSVQNDLMLLKKQVSEKEATTQDKKKKKRFSPLSIVYAGTMGFYQKQISPQWGANCAFEITCSHFSKQLVKEYGLAKGFFLSLDRIGRCNKLSFYETLPIRITPQGKIIDTVDFYRLD